MHALRWLMRVLLVLVVVIGGGIVAVTEPLFESSVSVSLDARTRASAERLRGHVTHLVRDFHPRDVSHPANMARAAAYIGAAMRKAGLDVREQQFQVGGGSYANVIGSIGPETKERLVLGAHYDAYGEAGGADDNGSGVAALLELARSLRSSSPSLRIELVAYALEEPPSFRTSDQGSRRHVAALLEEGVTVRAMLALETLGYYSSDDLSQHYPAAMGLLYPSRGDFVAVVGDLGTIGLVRKVKRAMRSAEGSTLEVRSANAPRSIPGVDYSDHEAYRAAGFPAVMITDTAFYRNPHYHELGDQPGTLDYEKLAAVVDAVYLAARELADDPPQR